MTYFVTADTDGESQIIWRQEKNDSCGPACIYMMENIENQGCTVGGEERVRVISGFLPRGYHEGNGTYADALATTLRALGYPSRYSSLMHGLLFVPLALGDNFPFIAHVRWSSGGHFVVCAKRARNNTLVCLDPWCGLVQVPISSLPQYNAASGLGNFSGHVILRN